MRENETRSRAYAKRLRRQLTSAETILWSHLRRDMFLGLRFRRQHPVGPFIADFACTAARLIVEIDGGTHFRPAETSHDSVLDYIAVNVEAVRKVPPSVSPQTRRDTSPVNGGGKLTS